MTVSDIIILRKSLKAISSLVVVQRIWLANFPYAQSELFWYNDTQAILKHTQSNNSLVGFAGVTQH